MESWFHHPADLFRSDRIFAFWPTASQSPAERINTSTRFVLYLACVLYLIKRDPRILVLAAMVVGVLYIFDRTGVVKGVSGAASFECQRPTENNPLGNVLLTDYDAPDRAPACYYPTVKSEVFKTLDNTVAYGPARSRSALPNEQRNAFARQFISAPVSSIPGDQTAFAEWCYGKKFEPMCRDDPSKCDPNYWGAQPEAYAGLDPSDGPRGGRGARQA
jgi:hypothetical protein